MWLINSCINIRFMIMVEYLLIQDEFTKLTIPLTKKNLEYTHIIGFVEVQEAMKNMKIGMYTAQM